MAPIRGRSKSLNQSILDKYLDNLNHHPNLDAADDCPEVLKAIFLLINRTRIGLEDLNPQLEGQTFNASHVYGKQLIWRAQELSRECSALGMNKKSEFDWQSALSPHVFQSLNNEHEERTNSERPYYHCLACCRVFRPGSRPLLNVALDARGQSNAEATLKAIDRDQICENDLHVNLPNFILQSQLRYNYQRGHGVPDATIGLCTYNLKSEPWQKQRPDLRTDPRIQPFTLRYLTTIFKDKSLTGPYPSRVLEDGVPLFAFALWEAKKSDGDSHWSAFTQLDKKVRSLLEWQDNIINEAESDSNEFIPVVWAFTSVGSSWTVYGCYQSMNLENGTHFGVAEWLLSLALNLWSGNVSDKNKALQLLWIIDILKFWAEYTYKPMVGACLALIKAHLYKQDELTLEETLWKFHITLNEENTPWFFHPVNSPRNKMSQRDSSSSGYNRPKLRFKSLSERCSPWSSETVPNQVLHRRPTLNEQQIDGFTWLLDRDPKNGNLLIIRLGREGKLDRPLILLDFEMFSRSKKRAQYSGRVPSRKGVDVGLIKGEGGIYLLQEHRSLFSSDHQFCAILPLESEAYQDLRRKSNKSSIFEPLEELLDLDGLYRIIDLECISHAACRRPQMKIYSNEESDEEDSAGSRQESDEEDSTGSRKESDEEDETGSHEGDCAEETSDDEVDQSSNYVESGDNVEDEEKAETDISKKWEHYLEHVHKAWERHKWPSEKHQILTFARIALKLETAEIKAYKANLDKMYSQVCELPIDCMTPVKGFRKSFLLIEGKEKRGPLVSKSTDNQSNDDYETEQKLVDSGDEGKKDVSKLGGKFKSLGVVV